MPERLEHVLARRLRDLARERRMPISHVADRCGMAHSYFWQILTAKASASLAVVQRLAEALDVEPLALLGGAQGTAVPQAAEDAQARKKLRRARPAGKRARSIRRRASSPGERRRS